MVTFFFDSPELLGTVDGTKRPNHWHPLSVLAAQQSKNRVRSNVGFEAVSTHRHCLQTVADTGIKETNSTTGSNNQQKSDMAKSIGSSGAE